MILGATPVGDACRFVVWAPDAERVELVLADGGTSAPLEPLDGYWHGRFEGIGAGARYRFRLDGGEELPDPASRHQPEGVHGPSAVVDPATFGWTDTSWRGVSIAEVVYYELHVGTFTPEGTFAAAADQLERIAGLGVTMIEVMPVGAFPGRRNWGYDGVFAHAVQESYGGPAGLAAFVDAAHRHGLGVTLDVVYNHLGPEGNVLPRFGPYFTDEYATPWGAALNFAGPGSDEVRRYFVQSAVQWVTDFHLDGLRLDAVHAIVDPTALTFVEQLVERVGRAGVETGRSVLVVPESAANDPRLVRPVAEGGHGCDAVWNDDFHHALRVALTGDVSGYYADYAGGSADLATALGRGFVYAGEHSGVRGRRHGRPADGVDPTRFVVFSQNHDQIGNRRLGDRLDANTTPAQRRLAAATVLLAPFTPLLFMGEEYGDPAPFPFFVDHQDAALLEAVRAGRAREFASFEWRGETPDPGDEATFRAAVLDHDLLGVPAHAAMHDLYRRLLSVRREHIAGRGWPRVIHDEGVIVLGYGSVTVALNFTDAPRILDSGDGTLEGTVLVDTALEGAAPVNTAAGDRPKAGVVEPWSAHALQHDDR